jgi:hypothetical protein
MNAASIVPEDDIQDQEPGIDAVPEEPESQERLSVFEDFLEGLDTGDIDTDSGDGEEGDEDDDGSPRPTI